MRTLLLTAVASLTAIACGPDASSTADSTTAATRPAMPTAAPAPPPTAPKPKAKPLGPSAYLVDAEGTVTVIGAHGATKLTQATLAEPSPVYLITNKSLRRVDQNGADLEASVGVTLAGIATAADASAYAFGNDGFMFRRAGAAWTPVTSPMAARSGPIDLALTAAGDAVAISRYAVMTGRDGAFTPLDVLPDKAVPASVTAASDGTFYVATDDKAVFRLAAGKASRVFKTPVRPSHLGAAADGTLYVADAHDGLLVRDPKGALTRFEIDGADPLPGAPMDLAVDADGRAWIACRQGLVVLDHGNLRTFPNHAAAGLRGTWKRIALSSVAPDLPPASEWSVVVGRVLRGGKPVAGATFTVTDDDHTMRRKATTDQEGRFKVSGVPAMEIHYSVSAGGDAFIPLASSIEFGGGALDLKDIDLL